MNNVNQPIRVLSTWKDDKKTLKKGRNDILYVYLGYIKETHSKKIISLVDDIDRNSSKIFFCKLYIGLKTTRILSKKLISEVLAILGKVHIDLWEIFSDISLKKIIIYRQ